MTTRILSALALVLACAASPAQATDTSSLSAFVQSCKGDAKGCHSMVFDVIAAARNNHYGCIPPALSTDAAADQLLDWLKDAADKNPKFEKERLVDVMWTGVDEAWPCHKK